MASPRRTTLVGVATGTLDGGVSVIRVSGDRAREVVVGLAGELAAARRLARRELRLESGIEEALVVSMPGPASFTGEDVVELQVHAGERNVREIMERLVDLGATPAGPGDFSRRAFDNGRLTLDQAEGIAALIGAQTDAAVGQARRLVAGEIGRDVAKVVQAIADLRVEIEAHLDFPEDAESSSVSRWADSMREQVGVVRGWERNFEAGRRARERPRVVISGPPNAGKSALFNALLGHDRALVTPAAGTTRDYLEGEIRIGPHAVMIVDTAGLRDGADEVESAGVARSLDQLEGADMVLWLEGSDQSVQPERASVAANEASELRVESKVDLGRRRADWAGVSAKTGEGLDMVRRFIARWFETGSDSPWIGLVRHRDRARQAAEAVEAAEAELGRGAGLELVAFHLAVGERRLAEITGRHQLGAVGADVLDAIFSRFCIGK